MEDPTDPPAITPTGTISERERETGINIQTLYMRDTWDRY